jgi:hypothetical protein
MQSVINDSGQLCVFNKCYLVNLALGSSWASHLEIFVQILQVGSKIKLDKLWINWLVEIFYLNNFILPFKPILTELSITGIAIQRIQLSIPSVRWRGTLSTTVGILWNNLTGCCPFQRGQVNFVLSTLSWNHLTLK